MDLGTTSCLPPAFFFEQSSSRRTPKRYKKLLEELPQDLRFAYVTPRVAAYLADKDKEHLKVSEQDADFGDGLGSKSLLPQISAKVTVLQNQLNLTLSNDEDSQRLLFQRAKETSRTLIQQLSRILYIFDGLHIGIPKPLEHQLTSNYKDLTADVNYVSREWQCPANKEEYLKKSMPARGEDTTRSSDDTHTDTGSVSNASRHTGEDDTRSVKSATEREAKQTAGRSQVRGKAGSRAAGGQLQDIAEDHGEMVSSRPVHRAEPPVVVGSAFKKESREKLPSPARPRTRLEKFKFAGITPSGTESRASATGSVRSNTVSRLKYDELQSMNAESTSDLTLVDRSGALIQFQLSSKQCEEKGWIVHPEVKVDRERETMLEWATQRLKLAIKQRKEQDSVDKENGRDKPVMVRYYGDSRRDVIVRQSRKSMSGKSAGRGKPDIPNIPDQQAPDKRVFMTTVSDGSTTIYYPSGLPAVITSCSLVHNCGYYALAFDDTPERNMLAAFTPSGRGCCYHKNGVVRFLSTEKEWTLAEDSGAVIRRSKWPSNGLKMSASMSIQLNSFLMLRCASHTNMYLYYNAVKETTKVSVGASCSDEAKEEQIELLSGLVFTSETAKEYTRPQKPKPPTTTKVKVSKSKGKNKQSPEIQKLLDMPEATENDADADRNLYRLQRKIKNLVEDWQEHYRIAVGIRSPHLHTLQSAPTHRQRPVQSASSGPPGARVIIESLSTAVPYVAPSFRIPSAPAGRSSDRMSMSSTKESKYPAPTGNAVKFNDDNIEVIVADDVSVMRSTPFQSTASMASSHRSIRSKSAPLVMTLAPDTVWSLRFGSCPVALRWMMLGEERATCRCSRHKIPTTTDVEYDEFIHKHIPIRQMVIISVMSSLYPDSTPAMDMLEQLYTERNRNRTQSCIQARSDAYRILLYDMASAADLTDHTNPLLLRRHNVVPGMFLMYDNGNLVFCDHIFNGYGNARKDFQKQIMATRRTAAMGRYLPKDFRFSPQKGRTGRRAAWGGEIGGTGVDNYGHAGISTLQQPNDSDTSLSSGDGKNLSNIDYRLSGLDSAAAQFINVRITSTGIRLDQDWSSLTSRTLSPLPADRHPVQPEIIQCM